MTNIVIPGGRRALPTPLTPAEKQTIADAALGAADILRNFADEAALAANTGAQSAAVVAGYVYTTDNTTGHTSAEDGPDHIVGSDGRLWVRAPTGHIDVDTVWTVPGMFPTPEAASLAASRYTVSPDAMLYIDVASGTYVNSRIYGHSSRRVKFRGAALSGAFPVAADFVSTGNGGAALAADVMLHETMLRSKFNTIFEYTSGVAVELRGAATALEDILLINTDGATSGVVCGSAAGESGNGSLADLNRVSIHNFASSQISTTYGGAFKGQSSALTVSGGARGIQMQYGGDGFAVGVVIASCSLYGLRFKRKGLFYGSSGTIKGCASAVSHIAGGQSHMGHSFFEGNGTICAIDNAGEFKAEGMTATGTTGKGIRISGGGDAYIDAASITGGTGTAIEVNSFGNVYGIGAAINNNGGVGVLNVGGDVFLLDGEIKDNSINVRHQGGRTHVTGCAITGASSSNGDVYLPPRARGSVDVTDTTGSPVVRIRTSANAPHTPQFNSPTDRGAWLYDDNA